MFMKKLVALLVSTLMLATAFAVELEIRLMPQLDFPFQKQLKLGYGGTASFDVVPFSVRSRDSVIISAQGGLLSEKIDVAKGYEFDNMNFYYGGLGLGYDLRFHDRISVAPSVGFGFWSMPTVPSQFLDYMNKDLGPTDTRYTAEDFAVSGLYVNAGLGVNFYIRPELAAFAYVGYDNMFVSSGSYLSDVNLGIGIKYNITKGLFAKAEIQFVNVETEPLFPVFYSRYDTNKFGTVAFKSNEKNDITDVEVQVFIGQYMTNPKTVQQLELLHPYEEVVVDLTAFLNENILNSMLNRKADAKIIIKYKSLGKSMSYSETIELQALSRNSMSWEDDRRAAAFVSGRDASALKFARQVVSVIKNDLSSNKPVNYQYAAAMFGALKSYGISYVIDPASAFTDNVGSASVDFLQFPYQTLLYHGGDCDDLTILNCSLLEALGIPTAFITCPGHIFMAFDAGIAVADADAVLGKGKYIVHDNTVWVPVEVTVSQDTFGLALSIAMREWNKYGEESVIIPLADAWREYKPVSVPESDITLQMPKREVILKSFKDAMK